MFMNRECRFTIILIHEFLFIRDYKINIFPRRLILESVKLHDQLRGLRKQITDIKVIYTLEFTNELLSHEIMLHLGKNLRGRYRK